MARHKKHHDDHEEHPSEAWLIALADMMTLLMVTFLMMFAISTVDLKKFEAFQEAFAEGTGTSLPYLPGTAAPPVGEMKDAKPGSPEGTPTPTPPSVSPVDGGKVLDRKDLSELKKKVEAAIKKAGLSDKIEVANDPRGLVVFVTSGVLFDSGDAEVTSTGRQLLTRLAPVFNTIGNELLVEGHTDSRPISSSRYPSNWELSALRATNVARYLMDSEQIEPKRVAVAGHASTKPRADLPTEEAYAKNRRVEIVVEAPPDAAPAKAKAPAKAPAEAPAAAPANAEHAEAPAEAGH